MELQEMQDLSVRNAVQCWLLGRIQLRHGDLLSVPEIHDCLAQVVARFFPPAEHSALSPVAESTPSSTAAAEDLMNPRIKLARCPECHASPAYAYYYVIPRDLGYEESKRALSDPDNLLPEHTSLGEDRKENASEVRAHLKRLRVHYPDKQMGAHAYCARGHYVCGTRTLLQGRY